jgi:hypothetical protein
MDTPSEDSKSVALREVYKQAFWVYTVIIALAIREVLADVLPRVFAYFQATPAAASSGQAPEPAFWLEIIRSLAFFIMITRFHLGGTLVLHRLNEQPSLPARSGFQVLTGFVHFLLFFAWALMVSRTAQWLRISLFMWILLLILLWDLPWCLLSPSSERAVIKPWVWRNLRTAIETVAIYASLRWLTNEAIAELAPLVWVGVVSLKELCEVFAKREPPDKFFAWL